MAVKALSAPIVQTIESLKTETFRLDEMGDRLPIGIFRRDGSIVRDYELEEYTGDHETALSRLTQRKKNKPFDILPQFLQTVVKSIGGVSVKEFCKDEELSLEALCGNLFLSDALSMLLKLRIDSYGNTIRLAGQCPNCRTRNVDSETEPSDLSSVEIKTCSMHSPTFELSLNKGAKFFKDTDSEETIDCITLRPLRVRDLAKMMSGKDEDQLGIEYKLAFASIAGTPIESTWAKQGTYNGVMAKTAIEELFRALNPVDRGLLLKAAGKLSGLGPLMRSGMVCKNCSTEFDVDVPWQDMSGFLSGII